MTLLFWSLAALMMVAAAGMVVRPLLAATRRPAAEREALLAAGRERLAELDRDLSAGTIEPQAAADARRELERDLLAAAAQGSDATEARLPSKRLSAAMAIAVPAAALALYFHLGSPGLIDPPAPAAQLEQAAADIAAHLEREPEDRQGWDLLTRAYAGLGRHAEAAQALARLIALEGERPDLLVRQADSLARAQGGRLEGRPQALLERALQKEPDNPAGLLLAGLADAEQGDYRSARDRWQRLLGLMGTGEAAPRAEVERLIRRAQEALGEAGAPAAVTVRVTLAPALQQQLDAGSTVFVAARARDGTRLPLAVARRPASALPFAITLDDAMAMAPGRHLSDHEAVDIMARVSRAGVAEPASGDLEGSLEGVSTDSSEPVELIIDRVVP